MISYLPVPKVFTAVLAATVLLTSCQQQTPPVADKNSDQSAEQIEAEENKKAVQSDSAKARIAQFQPLYAAQMQSLQRRLQAEYEALQAADNADSSTSLLTDAADTVDADNADADDASTSTVDNKSEINTSTEAGERDLEVLKRISLEPRQPKVLSEEQIIERYQQAMQALYQPVTDLLSAEDIDTLLNISTLLPQLFEHSEIAQRVAIKSPALARLIVQQQVAKQIEAQQILDMQQMKVTQQQEFAGLMAKFDDTIKGYDEQISNYEQTLKQFQQD